MKRSSIDRLGLTIKIYLGLTEIGLNLIPDLSIYVYIVIFVQPMSTKIVIFYKSYPTLNTLLAIRTEEAGYQAFYLK